MALRGGGGVTSEKLIYGMAGLYAVVGAQGWLAPKSTMEQYGVKEMSELESVCLRILSSFQVASAFMMLADSSNAASVGLTSWALATTANVAALEKLGTPKGPIVGFIGVFAALGELTRVGILDAKIGGGVLKFMLVVFSAMEIIPSVQTTTLESFGMPVASPLAKSLFENFSFTKLSTGLFLLVSGTTGKRGLGFAAASVATLLNCVKTIARADKVGLAKPGLAGWAVLNGALALLAFMNEKV